MTLSQILHSPAASPATPRPARAIPWLGYGVSVVSVAAATGLNLLLWEQIAPQVSPIFIAAVMVSAWVGGLGPGLFSTFLAGLASIYLFVDPPYSFRISPPDVLRLGIFLAVALLVSWLNARRKDAEWALAGLASDLEQKVIDRTIDLERTNVALRDQQMQLRELSWKLSQTEEAERRRIAQSLHDGLGQLLAVATIKVDSLLKVGATEDTQISEVRAVLEEALAQTRSLTVDLSPPVLYELGLKAAVEWLAQEMRRRYQLKVDVVCGALPAIDQVMRSVLFHAIRELLINVAKHAGSESARVMIAHGGAELDVLVEDKGRGFDADAVMASGGGRSGFGLFNVRERIHHLAGTFRVISSNGQGTRVQLKVPLANPGENMEGAAS